MGVAPPMVLLLAPWMRSTPSLPLATAPPAFRLRPMMLFWTVLWVAAVPLMTTPLPLLPEMRFQPEAVGPPTVLRAAPRICTPFWELGCDPPLALVPM